MQHARWAFNSQIILRTIEATFRLHVIIYPTHDLASCALRKHSTLVALSLAPSIPLTYHLDQWGSIFHSHVIIPCTEHSTHVSSLYTSSSCVDMKFIIFGGRCEIIVMHWVGVLVSIARINGAFRSGRGVKRVLLAIKFFRLEQTKIATTCSYELTAPRALMRSKFSATDMTCWVYAQTLQLMRVRKSI